MNRTTLARFATRALVAALLAAAAGAASAQWRYVVVNGERLSDLQVLQLERQNCSPIADGRYWYNAGTGAWGYEGDARPRGRFVNRCNWTYRDNGTRKSLSERGMLYSPGELLRD
jgi:hypothetical protein